jgi:uncharacterized membrane protein
VAWAEFAAAYAMFLLAHAVPARPAVRRRLVGLAGERGYVAGYVTASLALLAWLDHGGRAGALPAALGSRRPGSAGCRTSPCPSPSCWRPLPSRRAEPVLVRGRARRPTSIPSAPASSRLSRQPILLALGIWAGAHVVPNGNLAHVLLFGGFAAMAVLGMAMLERRRRRVIGEAAWRALARRTALLPTPAGLRAAASTPGAGARALAGLLGYAVALLLHERLFGVSPLPLP